jgi:hypothetical protein
MQPAEWLSRSIDPERAARHARAANRVAAKQERRERTVAISILGSRSTRENIDFDQFAVPRTAEHDTRQPIPTVSACGAQVSDWAQAIEADFFRYHVAAQRCIALALYPDASEAAWPHVEIGPR